MILGIAITEAGQKAVESYDGSNDYINFFEAFILSRASNNYVTMRDLVSSISNDFPFTMAPEAISNACTKLGQKGLLTLCREITDDTRILFSIAGIKLISNLKSLQALNPSLPVEIVRENLERNGLYHVTLTSSGVEFKATISRE